MSKDIFDLMDEVQALENEVAHLQRRVSELEALTQCDCPKATRHRPSRTFQEWQAQEANHGTA